MSEPVRRVLVAYDVSNDARRDRVAVALQELGERVQYSVFIVDGRPASFVRLRCTLESIIDHATDRILLCDLGPRDRTDRRLTFIGRQPRLSGDSPALIM